MGILEGYPPKKENVKKLLLYLKKQSKKIEDEPRKFKGHNRRS